MPSPEPRSLQERILGAAGRLFSERGFSNVSIRNICKEARTSLPMVYYYFGNKEGLFQAVVNRRVSMAKLIQDLEPLLESKKPADERLSQLIRKYLSSFPEDVLNVGLYIRNSSELDQESSRRLVSQLDRIQSIARQLIVEAITSGRFKRTDPSKATDCLLGMMNRFVFQRVHFGRHFNHDEVGHYISDFFSSAMRPHGKP